MTIDGMYQIGEVADQVGLSLRTIRHYEEVNLIPPSGRSAGGFRLYTDEDVARLRVVKHLKPIGFSLEDMQQVLIALDAARTGTPDGNDAPARAVLATFAVQAEEGCHQLRDKLTNAVAITRTLRQEADGHHRSPA